jgi:MFS family permease
MMAEMRAVGQSPTAAGFVLGRKLDNIPFGSYHVIVIGVLALVGFVEGYDLSMTGLLLVLAKGPLHLSGADIRWLVAGPTFMACVGGFTASALSDHWSRKTIMQIGIAGTTFFTL